MKFLISTSAVLFTLINSTVSLPAPDGYKSEWSSNQMGTMPVESPPMMDGKMMNGQMMDGKMMNGQMMDGKMMNGQMMDGKTMDNQMGKMPMESAPMMGSDMAMNSGQMM